MRQHKAPEKSFDIFTVRATDGFGGAVTTAQVRVTVAPTPTAPTVSVTSVSPIRVGESPIGMTVVGNRIYVVNSTANTLSVIDTSTKQVVDTISVPAGYPVAVAATADGQRVYLAYYQTVSVVDTSTDAVVATIPIPPTPCEWECWTAPLGITDLVIARDRVYRVPAVGWR